VDTWAGSRSGLADQRHRMDEMRVGDREVRASVLLSYAGLPDVERCAVRRLALLDAPDFAGWVVGTVLGPRRQGTWMSWRRPLWRPGCSSTSARTRPGRRATGSTTWFGSAYASRR
jgi:hypothetical protein